MRNPQLVRWTCGFLKIPNRHLPLSLWRQDLVSVLWSVRLSSCQLQEWQLGGRKLNSLQDLDCVVAITPLYSTKLGHRPTLTNVLKCYALTASLSVGDGTLSWSCYRRPKSQIFFWAAVLCLSSHSHVIMWGTGVDWILRWACNAESIHTHNLYYAPLGCQPIRTSSKSSTANCSPLPILRLNFGKSSLQDWIGLWL